jgi:hypothetical protein
MKNFTTRGPESANFRSLPALPFGGEPRCLAFPLLFPSFSDFFSLAEGSSRKIEKKEEEGSRSSLMIDQSDSSECSGGLPDFSICLNHNTTTLQLNIKTRNSSGTTTHPKKPSVTVTPDPPPNSTPEQTKPNLCSNSNALNTGLLLQKNVHHHACAVMTARSSQASNPRTASERSSSSGGRRAAASQQRVARRAGAAACGGRRICRGHSRVAMRRRRLRAGCGW